MSSNYLKDLYVIAIADETGKTIELYGPFTEKSDAERHMRRYFSNGWDGCTTSVMDLRRAGSFAYSGGPFVPTGLKVEISL